VTLIPASLVGDVPIRKTNQVLTAANGPDVPFLGELDIMLKIGVRETSSLALVSEHEQEIMLGIEWLEKNGVVWDVAKGKVTIGSRDHHLYRRTGARRFCRRVVLRRDVVIPPRLEMDVSTNVVFERLPGEQKAPEIGWATEPAVLSGGIHVSRTLIPDSRFEDIPIRVMNVHSELITIW